MKMNDFYEVDGCIDFIPAKIVGKSEDRVIVTVSDDKQSCQLVVKEVYRLPKVHEPQKVTVPKFVAKWIEECKRSDWHLQKALYSLDDDEKVGNWAYDEYDENGDLISEKVDMIARAWLDGYQVEKEKLYTVEIPNPNNIGAERTVLMKNGFNQIVMLRVYDHSDNWRTVKGYQLTESEIKQDFEWAWQWAKEVENDTEM